MKIESNVMMRQFACGVMFSTCVVFTVAAFYLDRGYGCLWATIPGMVLMLAVTVYRECIWEKHRLELEIKEEK